MNTDTRELAQTELGTVNYVHPESAEAHADGEVVVIPSNALSDTCVTTSPACEELGVGDPVGSETVAVNETVVVPLPDG